MSSCSFVIAGVVTVVDDSFAAAANWHYTLTHTHKRVNRSTYLSRLIERFKLIFHISIAEI